MMPENYRGRGQTEAGARSGAGNFFAAPRV
jgi:hypothetical protein